MNITLGEVIRKQRRASDMTQAELGKQCDCSRAYISSIERGTANPTWETIVKILNALGLEWEITLSE